jgi:hypothetical protein
MDHKIDEQCTWDGHLVPGGHGVLDYCRRESFGQKQHSGEFFRLLIATILPANGQMTQE